MNIRYTQYYVPSAFTDEEISIAVKPFLGGYGMLHESPDSVRIAVEWLSAQRRTARPTNESLPIKHLKENWGGRYVSRGDVEVAASLLKIQGRYPRFALDLSNPVLPDSQRLTGIAEAYSQEMYRLTNQDSYLVYKIKEVIE